MSYLDDCSDGELFEKFFKSFNFGSNINDLNQLNIIDDNKIMLIKKLRGDVNLLKFETYDLFTIKEILSNITTNEYFVKRADDDEDMFYATAKILMDRVDDLIIDRNQTRRS